MEDEELKKIVGKQNIREMAKELRSKAVDVAILRVVVVSDGIGIKCYMDGIDSMSDMLSDLHQDFAKSLASVYIRYVRELLLINSIIDLVHQSEQS